MLVEFSYTNKEEAQVTIIPRSKKEILKLMQGLLQIRKHLSHLCSVA